MVTKGPIKGNEHLTEEIEIEEVIDEAEEHNRYIMRKEMYAENIMGELEAFIEKPADEWNNEDEDKLIDILDLVDILVKCHLSNGIPSYMQEDFR